MNQEKEKQYREEFEKEFPHLNFAKINGEYEFTVTKRDWDYYLAGRKKGNEEFKEEHEDKVSIIKMQDKEIAQLKAENEEWKQEAHKRLNEMINDHWFKKYKELKEQLKREAECVDFYAALNWDGDRIEASDVSREKTITHHYVTLGDLPEDITSVSMGGKRARSVQAQRKVL